MTKSIYKDYAFFVFCHLSQIIQKGFGIKMDVYPCEDGKHTIILITFKEGEDDNVEISKEISTPNALALAGIEHIFCSLDIAKLEGTNAYVGSDRIVYIKENRVDLFSDDAVREDVLTLAQHRIGRA